MFHSHDNLFFGRIPDGSVRILKFHRPPAKFPRVDGLYTADEVSLDVLIPCGSWCSVVASMSLLGEENLRWYAAMSFHGAPTD